MSSTHEAAFLTSWRRSIKGRGENALEAEQPLGLFEAYLFIYYGATQSFPSA